MDKIELLGMDIHDLEKLMTDMGEAPFRGRQIHKWIYGRQERDFAAMSDIPAPVRVRLADAACISIPTILQTRVSVDGTRKFLMELSDGKTVECVVIPQGHYLKSKYTICISTQVGCPLGCDFCATGKSGFIRNLKGFEIVGQVLGASRELARSLPGGRQSWLSNVVYMGMGEPMLNYDEVIKSLYVLLDPRGMNMGQRHITISTSGDARGIKRLSKENLQVNLAISLHACDNELRSRLMPINQKYPLEKLMAAVNDYIRLTGRRVTFEYILLAGVNDRRRDAGNMIKWLQGMLANVNLIPYNEVGGLPYRKPAASKVEQFLSWLKAGGLNVTVRQEKGADIEAACGQLRGNC